MMLTQEELKIFQKYQDGEIFEAKDERIIYTLSSVGMIRIGVSKLEGKAVETAILTPLGRNIMKREIILRNPLKKFLYSLVNI